MVIIPIDPWIFFPVVSYALYKYNPYSTENKNFWSFSVRCLKSISTWTQGKN